MQRQPAIHRRPIIPIKNPSINFICTPKAPSMRQPCTSQQTSCVLSIIPSSLLSNTTPSESVEHSAAADMQPEPGPTQTPQHSATRTPRIAWRRRGRRASSHPNRHATRSRMGCVGTDLMTILDMLTRAHAAQIGVRYSGTEGAMDVIGHPMMLSTVREADRG